MIKNVVWLLPSGQILVTDLSAQPDTSQAYVAANRQIFDAGWQDISYDAALPADPALCSWNGTAVVVNQSAAIAKLINDIFTQVNAMVGALAVSWGYDNAQSCAGYVNDPFPVFAHQAAAFVAWRSAVFSKLYQDRASLEAGTLAIPASAAAYIATLPAAPAMPTA